MKIVRNALGFAEVEPKPTAEDLRAHYRARYFAAAESNNQYAHPYTDEELRHKSIVGREALLYVDQQASCVLELGVGEGFFLRHFDELGWEVHGVDFTDDGLRAHTPQLLGKVHIGDMFDYVDDLCRQGRRFDLIACNNILEHVIDPLAALKKIRSLLSPRGVCRIVVPNDGSWLQHEIVRRKYAQADFWVSPPEHLSYFTIDTLRRTLESEGFSVIDMLADFPIDLFLLNPDTNYMSDRSKGRNCHFVRTAFESSLAEIDFDKLIAFRRGCAQAGIGRNAIAYSRAAR